MDPVVLDLPTTAWERPPAKNDAETKPAFQSQVAKHPKGIIVSEWVADGGEGWGETLFLPCAPRPQSSSDLKDSLYSDQGIECIRPGSKFVLKL